MFSTLRLSLFFHFDTSPDCSLDKTCQHVAAYSAEGRPHCDLYSTATANVECRTSEQVWATAHCPFVSLSERYSVMIVKSLLHTQHSYSQTPTQSYCLNNLATLDTIVDFVYIRSQQEDAYDSTEERTEEVIA